MAENQKFKIVDLYKFATNEYRHLQDLVFQQHLISSPEQLTVLKLLLAIETYFAFIYSTLSLLWLAFSSFVYLNSKTFIEHSSDDHFLQNLLPNQYPDLNYNQHYQLIEQYLILVTFI